MFWIERDTPIGAAAPCPVVTTPVFSCVHERHDDPIVHRILLVLECDTASWWPVRPLRVGTDGFERETQRDPMNRRRHCACTTATPATQAGSPAPRATQAFCLTSQPPGPLRPAGRPHFLYTRKAKAPFVRHQQDRLSRPTPSPEPRLQLKYEFGSSSRVPLCKPFIFSATN